MADFVVILILLMVIGAALTYVIKSKKAGVKCIGCPSGATCPHSGKNGSCQGGCGCNCHS